MTDVGGRAFKSLSKKQGQFSLLLDENFDVIWQSDSLTATLGWPDVLGRNGTEFVHPDDLELVLRTMMQISERDEFYDVLDGTDSPESSDIRIIDRQGRYRSFETTADNYLDDPDIRAVLCTCKIVRDRSDVARSIELLGRGADVGAVLPVLARLADQSMGGASRCALASREGRGFSVVTAADEPPIDQRLADAAGLVWSLGLVEPTVITDLDDARLGGIGAVASMAGYRTAYLVPIEAPSGPEIIGAMVAWGTYERNRRTDHAAAIDFTIAHQSPLHLALRLAALSIADGRLKRELRWAASHDPLTGLVNRAKFAQHLDEMSNDELVLLYIDLDDFKPINDTFGHPVGDSVLIEVSRRIACVIGPNDLVGRLGGDEFAVICAGTADPAHGRAVADQIIEAIGAPIFTRGLHLRVGASVGVAVGAQPLIPDVLVHKADQALYVAKSSGKNTVCLAA